MADLEGRELNYVKVGQEGEPCLILDQFYPSPKSLVEFAVANGGVGWAKGGYPGVRSPSPISYDRHLLGCLPEVLYEVFGFQLGGLSQIESAFSMVLTPPENLTLPQRIPHYDRCKKTDLALILYLCPDTFGGTSFYRHIDTGFEYIDAVREPEYKKSLTQRLQSNGQIPKGYICGTTELFERVFTVKAQFNRLAIYRVSSLHSGDIPPDYPFLADPYRGRFTLTSFMSEL